MRVFSLPSLHYLYYPSIFDFPELWLQRRG